MFQHERNLFNAFLILKVKLFIFLNTYLNFYKISLLKILGRKINVGTFTFAKRAATQFKIMTVKIKN